MATTFTADVDNASAVNIGMSSTLNLVNYLKLCNQVKKITLFSSDDVDDKTSNIKTTIFDYVHYDSTKQEQHYLPLNVKLVVFDYLSVPNQTNNPRNITTKWFKPNELTSDNYELLEDYVIPVVTQRFSELFEKIRNIIEIEKGNQSSNTAQLGTNILSDEFENFCVHFTKHIQSLYTELSQIRKSISLDGNMFALFDWTLLYSASFKSLTLFNIIFEASEFQMLAETDFNIFASVMNKCVINKYSNIINILVKRPDGLGYLIDKFGILKTWRLILANTEPSIGALPMVLSSYCKKIFDHNLIPDVAHQDYEEICAQINSFRDTFKRNFMHYLVAHHDLHYGLESVLNCIDNFRNNATIFEPFCGLKYEEDNFSLLPIMYAAKYLDTFPSFVETKNIALQANINSRTHPINENRSNHNIDFLLSTKIFTYQDFIVVKNNMAAVTLPIFFNSLIKVTSVEENKTILIDNLNVMINSMLYNFGTSYFEVFVDKLIDELGKLNDDSIMSVLTTQVKLFEYDCEYSLFEILGSLHLIDKLLESSVETNIIKIQNQIKILLKMYPYVFNFGTKYNNQCLLNYANITSDPTFSLKINPEYCFNMIKYLEQHIENIPNILLYLESIYVKPDISNKEFYNAVQSHILSYANLILGETCKVPNIENYHISTLLKYLTSMLATQNVKYIDIYSNYFTNDIYFDNALTNIIKLSQSYEYCEFNSFDNILCALTKFAEYNEDEFVKVIVSDPLWYLWSNVNELTCNVFTNFVPITQLILSNPNCKLAEIEPELIPYVLTTLTSKLTDTYDILVEIGHFDNICNKYASIVRNFVESKTPVNVFAAMCLPNFNFSLVVEEFIKCVKELSKPDMTSLNDIMMDFVNWIVDSFVTTTNGKICLINSVPFIGFSQLFIDDVIKNSEDLFSSQTLYATIIHNKMFKSKLISRHTCEVLYPKLLNTYENNSFHEFLGQMTQTNNDDITNVVDFLDLNYKSEFSSLILNKILRAPLFIVNKLLTIKEFKEYLLNYWSLDVLNLVNDEIISEIIKTHILPIDKIYPELCREPTAFNSAVNTYGLKNLYNIIYNDITHDTTLPCITTNFANFNIMVNTLLSDKYNTDQLEKEQEIYLINHMVNVVHIMTNNYMSIEFFGLILSREMINLITAELMTELITKLLKLISLSLKLNNLQTAQYMQTYAELCSKLNIPIVCENELVTNYPTILLASPNFDDKVKLLELNTLIALVKSSNITPIQQDAILTYVTSMENTMYLEKLLSSVLIFTDFVANNFKKIKNLASKNSDIMQNLVGFDECPIDMLFAENVNGDFLLMSIPISKISSKTSKKFIELMTTKQLLSANKRGNLKILHFLYNPYIEHILNRNDVGMLFSDKKIGPIVFSSLIESVVEKSFVEILNMFPENIRSGNDYTDTDGNNFYMALVESFNSDSVGYDLSEVINTIEVEVAVNKEILTHKNDNGNNLLFLSVRHTEIFFRVLNLYIKILGPESLMEANINSETLLMHIIRYNCDILPDLLKNENINIEQNYVYANTGSILTYAIVYTKNSDIFDSLLKWTKISSNCLDMTQQVKLFDWTTKKYEKIHLSTVGLSCIYAPEIFRKMIKSLDLTYIASYIANIGKSQYNLINLAYLYEPESFQHLCGSDKVPLQFTKEQHDFFLKYAETQPASWYNFVGSKLFNSKMYKQQDYNKIYHTIRPNNIKNQSISRYVQTKNEVSCAPEDKCEICVQNKKKIMFGCLQHFACVCCCLKSEVCPFCRNADQRIKIFD